MKSTASRDGPRPYEFLARNVGHSLCHAALGEGPVRYWVTSHPTSYGYPARDLYIGSAGVALCLCDLFEVSGVSKFVDYAERCASWLAGQDGRIGRESPLPGLYFGEAGIGYFFLRLFQATEERKYLEWAADKSEAVMSIRTFCPDILTGVAGIGLFHLAMFRATREKVFLKRAHTCAQSLADLQSPDGSWRIPDNYEDLSGNAYLGFAHGIAGIGYFFIALYEDTGDAGCLEKVQGIADFLVDRQEPALNDNSGVNWQDTVDRATFSLYWCHGAAGIGRFFTKALPVLKSDQTDVLVTRIGKTLVEAGRWVGPTQCHGLAGNIEVLLDIHAASASSEWLREARELAECLLVYARRDGRFFRWQSEMPSVRTPDLMVGEAGVAACLLRLENPGMPHTISLDKVAKSALNGSGVVVEVGERTEGRYAISGERQTTHRC